ncbi:MAG: NAD(P)H-hydrate dehydratase [Candidatus Thermoplasmatota archaeon]|nr:NAD(P)H-hydrate dehydratase [Candidatus Thermoplasmatota archaeon]
MLTYRDVLALDRNSEYWLVPQAELMENAGRAVAGVALRHIEKGRNVIIICGLGNNGGDGFVAARYLKENNCNVKVILLGKPEDIKTEIAKANYDRVRDIAESFENVNLAKELEKADIIIDAMLGVGVSGKLKEPYLSVVKLIDKYKSSKFIIAVDVPTGLGTTFAVIPNITVTFHDLKEGMSRKNSGRIIVEDIGIPKEAEKCTGPGELVYYPKPEKDSKKGDNGRVLVIGGGPYTGAPALAASAAYRTGVDLVHLAVPSAIYQITASYSPNFIVHSVDREILTQNAIGKILELAEKVDSVVIGPGLGNAKETKVAIKELVAKITLPLVIDANAFDAIKLHNIKNKTGVVTPHSKEFKKLTGQAFPKELDKRISSVEKFAKQVKMVILLKAPIDIISNGSKTKLSYTGNEAMTVGGTGDVLAGIVAALLAKKVEPFRAACMGAFINGHAGDLVFKEKSYSLLATDIIEKIPMVLKEFL